MAEDMMTRISYYERNLTILPVNRNFSGKEEIEAALRAYFSQGLLTKELYDNMAICSAILSEDCGDDYYLLVRHNQTRNTYTFQFWTSKDYQERMLDRKFNRAADRYDSRQGAYAAEVFCEYKTYFQQLLEE